MLLMSGVAHADTSGEDWKEGSELYAKYFGPFRYRKNGPFIVDYQIGNPKKALSACRHFAETGYKRSAYSGACEMFLYPSGAKLPQAAEARSIYERLFERATTQPGRVAVALTLDVGADYEIMVDPSPEVLNAVYPERGAREARTVAEAYALHNRTSPQKVQWLYDHGARLCEKDWGPPERRFSCLTFYSTNDDQVPHFDETLAVLERNGFRPRSGSEVYHAIDGANLIREGRMDSYDRYYALLDARTTAQVAARRKENEAQIAAAKLEKARAEGLIAPTDAENLAAAKRFSEVGTPVCRKLMVEGRAFRFAATVEKATRTRLQLRAGSIRSDTSEFTNLPYHDTRISPGVVFWDDAGSWSDCRLDS